MNDTIARIAREHLSIDTLETRNSDSLDFHDVAVWSIKAALEAAYEAGQAASKSSKKSSGKNRNPLDKRGE